MIEFSIGFLRSFRSFFFLLVKPYCLINSDIFILQNAAYLLIRGMKTLHLRVQQQNSSALRMAKLLEAHPKVCNLIYQAAVLYYKEKHNCILFRTFNLLPNVNQRGAREQ